MANPRILGLIPARYASTRFPGKPLATIAGRSMVRWVLDRAGASGVFDTLAVATDDERILQHVQEGGGRAVMTSPDHVSGTSRCLEAMDILARDQGRAWDVVVNIQGDEPFLDPLDLQRLTLPFAGAGPDIATLVCPIQRLEELEDPNIVKAVGGELGQALYFSRSPIPYLRDLPRERWMEQPLFRRHIGIYAFSSLILREICALPPSGAERAESLEQLRWLAAGYTIRLIGTSAPGPGVDTPADLEKAERLAARYSA